MALRAVPDHPKFADLAARLGRPRYVVLGCLETIWHFAGRFTPQGNLGKYTDQAIEAWVGWDGEPGALIAALTGTGWIDADPVHRLLVHDWSHHADKATKLSLQRGKHLFCTPSVHTLSVQSGDGVEVSGTVYGLPVPVPEPVPEAKAKFAKDAPLQFVLPEWISLDVWKDFEEMRRKKRAPLTDRARKNIVKELIKLEATGQIAEEVLNQSITNSWSGVFPLNNSAASFTKSNRNTPSQPGTALTQAQIAARDQQKETQDREAYEMWVGMSADFKAANPWRGHVFELAVGA